MRAEGSRKAMSEGKRHAEGVIARTIEDQTAKMPSDLFLWAALGSIATSIFFEITGDQDKSRFFGQWVAPLLVLGVYNNIVKVAGSDRAGGSQPDIQRLTPL